MKPMRLALFAALAAMMCGCDKSSQAPTTVPFALTSQTVAHLHWLGKKQLAADTNSATLMRIWSEPESATLEAQTLDRLSTAPWRLLPHAATTNSAAAPLLRELLEDCVQQESYLEVRAVTNQPGEFAFAIQLPAGRAAVWQTNLAAVLESLTGIQPVPTERGWSLKKHDTPNLIELTRADDWIVIGLGQEKNALLGDFVARIHRSHSPQAGSSQSLWLDAAVDLRSVVDALKLNWHPPADFPKISVQSSGDGQSVQARGEMDFQKPLNLPLDPWNLPTNLIRGPVASFTALRGIAPWLGSQKVWQDLQIGAAPNQFFVWAGWGVPMQTLFATPSGDASNRMSQISDSFMAKIDPWLNTNLSGHLEPATEFQGINWIGMPFLGPYLRSQGDFLFGGFFPPGGGKAGLPAEMMFALNRTNTVYYDWEITSPRIEAWFYMGQTLRIILHKSQLPDSAAMSWLKANTNSIGNCLTTVTLSRPEQLTFYRRSSGIGLTAFEMHLLADWLESPQFPLGLNTFLGRPEGVRARRTARPVQLPPP